MKETCSCGAKFEYTRVEGMPVDDQRLERVYEMLKDWRKNHRHEFVPEPAEMPLIHESTSSHEREPEVWLEGARAQAGFTRNEVR